MPLKVNCPEGHTLTVPKQRAGTYVRCPICMQTVKIPVASPQPTAKQSTKADAAKADVAKGAASAKSAAAKQPTAKKRADNTKQVDKKPAARMTQLTSRPTKTTPATTTAKEKTSQPPKSQPSKPTDRIDDKQPQPAEAKPPTDEKKMAAQETPKSRSQEQHAAAKKVVAKKPGAVQPTSDKPKQEGTPAGRLSIAKREVEEQAKKQDRITILPDEVDSLSVARKRAVAEQLPAENKRPIVESPSPKPSPTAAPKDNRWKADDVEERLESGDKKSGDKKLVDKKPESTEKKPDDAAAKQQQQVEKPDDDRLQKKSVAAPPPSPKPQPEAAPDESKTRQVAASTAPGEPPALLPVEKVAKEKVFGVEHELAKRWTAYYLGISLSIIGLLNMLPAFYDFYKYYDLANPEPFIHRWAYVVLFVGGLQLAYSFYLVQLPDWSSVWVVAVFTLVAATGYAMVLGVVVLGKEESRIVQVLGLSSGARRSAGMWCLSMLSALSLLTYFCGREGMRWHKIYKIQGEVAGVRAD